MKKNGMTPDPSQRRAIRHGGGPCAVIAGPGSGKTMVLTQRVRYLIHKLGADPSGILVMTFSRAAAVQMQRRFAAAERESLPSPGGRDVVFGTFHSVFYRILQESSGQRLRIVSQREKAAYLRHLCRVHPDLQDKVTPEDLQLLISRSKNGLACAQPWLPSLIRDYDQYLRARGCLDFDDMILGCCQLLKSCPDVLRLWSGRFPWILVDEFQDVSPSQYEALRLLSGPRGNLFVVGDDDQSIYGFRGADPSVMRRFLRDYGLDGKDPLPGRIFLTTNYRCARRILEAGAALIRGNRNRISKSFRAGSGEEGSFVCRPFSDRESQYSLICRELLSMKPEDRGKTALIFRTHSAARKIRPFLLQNRIPFVEEGGSPARVPPSPRAEILLDLTSYYRAAEDLVRKGASRRDLMRIMNRPERFLSGSFLPSDRASADSLLAGAAYEKETLKELVKDLALLHSLDPRFSFRYLLDSMGYRAFSTSAFPQEKEILDDLASWSGRFTDAAGWLAFLQDRLSREEGKSDQKDRGNRSGDSGTPFPGSGQAVHVLTMHACKGLEYDHVYIPDLNEGSVPAKQAWTSNQIEEERRLLYVAMTRARKTLTMTYLEGTPDRPAAPSRFLIPLCDRMVPV